MLSVIGKALEEKSKKSRNTPNPQNTSNNFNSQEVELMKKPENEKEGDMKKWERNIDWKIYVFWSP